MCARARWCCLRPNGIKQKTKNKTNENNNKLLSECAIVRDVCGRFRWQNTHLRFFVHFSIFYCNKRRAIGTSSIDCYCFVRLPSQLRFPHTHLATTRQQWNTTRTCMQPTYLRWNEMMWWMNMMTANEWYEVDGRCIYCEWEWAHRTCSRRDDAMEDDEMYLQLAKDRRAKPIILLMILRGAQAYKVSFAYEYDLRIKIANCTLFSPKRCVDWWAVQITQM